MPIIFSLLLLFILLLFVVVVVEIICSYYIMHYVVHYRKSQYISLINWHLWGNDWEEKKGRLDKQGECRKKDKSKESYYDSIKYTTTTHTLQKKRDPRTEYTRNSSCFISQYELPKGLTNTIKSVPLFASKNEKRDALVGMVCTR